jgi:hypothetical protein
MRSRNAAHVFERLLSGTVPDRGLDEIAVGIETYRKELLRKVENAKNGEGDVKFLRGGYGCGKTFMARLALQDALERKFVTSFVVVSDNDLHFHKFDELYRKVVSGLSTPACPHGALSDILDRWIGSLEEGLIDVGVPEDDPAFDQKVLAKLDEQLSALTGGRAPADMVRAVRAVFSLKQQGKLQEASALISWLSGSENVAAGVKSLAQIKGDISSSDALGYLRGILEMVKSAGYNGLIIVIDEAETILRMRGDVRQKSLNAIRQIVDAAKDYPGLLWIFTGTPTFFEDRRGVKGLDALYDRIKFESFGEVASMRQPQLDLKPFDRERLVKVALKVRTLHGDLSPDEAEKRLPKEFIERLADEVTKGFRGDVGVVPRQFLRTFANIVDILATNPDQDPFALLGFTPSALTVQEAAALEGRPLEVPPEDDAFGGAGVDM